MAYNKSKAEKEWLRWKEAEEKKLRELGVDEETIQRLHTYDWAQFNKERQYLQRQVDWVSAQGLELPVEDIESLLDSIEDMELFSLLHTVDKLNAIQCMGFAYKLAYDAYGSSARTWTQQYNLKPGDIIRYDTHSIFVTAVNGDTIIYGDANGQNSSCIIRWNRSTTKSAILNRGLVYVKIAPWNLLQNSSAVTESGLIDGGVYYIKNHWQDKYLDVKDAEVYNGAKLQVHPLNRSDAQKWRVRLNPNGTYKIISMLDERYTLDLTDGLDVQENRIQLWESNANVNSQFMLTNNPNGTKSILPAGSATRALDIYSGPDATRYSYAVQIYTKNSSSPSQQWTFEPADGVYYIKNLKDGKYLDVPGANLYNGALLQVHSFNGTDAQKWQLSRNEDGTYKIFSVIDTSYIIDIDLAEDVNGKRVQVWENNYNINSKFNITIYDGKWHIRPAFSTTRVFDVASEDGCTLQLWEICLSNQNQYWVFEPV